MSGSFTPGPWFNLRPKAGSFATIGTKGPNGPIRHIAEGCWNDEQAEADARLIAAAPELLEAAEKALNYVTNTEGELGITLDSGEALRAAIAKAHGENAL